MRPHARNQLTNTVKTLALNDHQNHTEIVDQPVWVTAWPETTALSPQMMLNKYHLLDMNLDMTNDNQ